MEVNGLFNFCIPEKKARSFRWKPARTRESGNAAGPFF